MNYLLVLLISAMMSMFAVHWVFMKILKIAKLKGLVDAPNARKLQKIPVPVLGGLAVFFGLLAGLLCASALFHFTSFTFENTYDTLRAWSSLRGMLLPAVLGASIVLYTGAIDDTIGLSPLNRFIIEIAVILGICYGSGMCVDSLHGLFGINDFSWWIGIPLTVFAGVGIINAFNMVDGVNGLSSGLCIVVSFLMGTFFIKRNDVPDALLAYCFASSLIPFFFHNVFGKYSRMFIGDAGTMVMGLIVSWCLIKTLSTDGVIGSLNHKVPKLEQMCLPAMLLAICSVPVMDTLRVMSERMLKGVSPFKADKNHLHHKFIAIGISHSVTALLEMCINFAVVGVWYIVYKIGMSQEMQLLYTILASVLFIWGTYFFLSYQEKHKTIFTGLLKDFSDKTHFGHKKWWIKIQRILDKDAYVDMALFLKDKFNVDIDNMNEKEADAVTLLNYLQGKKKESISSVTDNAELLHIENLHAIIKRLEEDGIIEVLQHDKNGEAKVIRISKSIKNI